MSDILVESSFCKNCDNLMDITNNISNTTELIEQQGGYNIEELDGVQVESSEYDVSMSESVGGSSINEDNISSILDGSDIDVKLSKNFDINELNKNSSFNKLTNEQKTLVINRILEKNPKPRTNKQTHISMKESYFYCKSCGYYKKIPNKKFIFSRGNENKNEEYNLNFTRLINDPTLPTSKNYNCINPNCTTHKNPNLKSAIFYRHIGSYNIRYICKVCNKFWDTYNSSKNV